MKLKVPKQTPLQKKLYALQDRVDRINELAGFLTTHPHLAAESRVKPPQGLVGLVIRQKAFVKPIRVNRPGLKMEQWLEDTFTEVSPENRLICDDVSVLSSAELETLLDSIPDPDGEDDEEDDDE